MLTDPNRIIVALDYDNQAEALSLVAKLDPSQCRLKVGKEMFTHFGPAFIKELHSQSFEIFLDLKFHDIPNTVAKACRAAADLGVWMINCHASGGLAMMQTAKQALAEYGDEAPLFTAVTVLTSMSQEDLQQSGISMSIPDRVTLLAELTQQAGLDGIVCSALEAEALRAALGPDFLLVTPGIRPVNSAADDQKRIMTPARAISSGSSYLVIGRPITKADDPMKSLSEISQSFQGVLN